MGLYIDAVYVKRLFGAYNIGVWADLDPGESPEETATARDETIDLHIEIAEDLAHVLMSGGLIAVPLAEENIRPSVKWAVAMIAGYSLWCATGLGGASIEERNRTMETGRRKAEEFLRSYAYGRRSPASVSANSIPKVG